MLKQNHQSQSNMRTSARSGLENTQNEEKENRTRPAGQTRLYQSKIKHC